jgi:hypothetical protein
MEKMAIARLSQALVGIVFDWKTVIIKRHTAKGKGPRRLRFRGDNAGGYKANHDRLGIEAKEESNS